MPTSRREFFSEVPYLNPLQLRERVRNADEEEQRLFEEYYGAARFQRIRNIILADSLGAAELGLESRLRQNVVILPGIMGSEIALARAGARPQLHWLHLRLLFSGRLNDLRLAADGRTSVVEQLVASSPGILSLYFDELEQFLLPKYNLRRFPYDWRRDIRDVAGQLDSFLRFEFGNEPVHVIAHSLGGLVARAMIAGRIRSGTPRDEVLGRGGRLLMLGTPNQGAYEAFKILNGTQDSIQLLAVGLHTATLFLTDFQEEVRRVLGVVHSFPSVYQMLPRPELLADGGGIDFYAAAGYSDLGEGLSDRHFQTARETHALLDQAVIPDSMRIVAGCDSVNRTAAGLTSGVRVSGDTVFTTDLEGDGTVSHALTALGTVPRYFVSGGHGDLMSHSAIFQAIDDLLLGDAESVRLSKTPLSPLEVADTGTPNVDLTLDNANRDALFQTVMQQEVDDGAAPTPAEVRLRKLVVSGWLGGKPRRAQAPQCRLMADFEERPLLSVDFPPRT